jgi:hypothetical protein
LRWDGTTALPSQLLPPPHEEWSCDDALPFLRFDDEEDGMVEDTEEEDANDGKRRNESKSKVIRTTRAGFDPARIRPRREFIE